MPAAVAVPLITAGVGAGASIFGAHEQAGATQDAATLQNQYNLKALAAAQEQLQWQRQQYANYLQRMQPYNTLGMSAGTTLSNLLARSPYASYANGPNNAAPVMSQLNPGATAASNPAPAIPVNPAQRYPQNPSLPNVQY